jgi:hypothetical protein
MDVETLVRTRAGLHALAEHVIAADLWERTGRIGLRRTPGGFGQPEHLDADGARHRLRVDGSRLVVLHGDVERWEELSTPTAAATFAQCTLGAPADVYTPETELRSEEDLGIDTAAAALLADWFELGERALEELRRRHARRAPTIPQLWPEHFDLAFSMEEVNLGASPGDAQHPEPYLYVGPWQAVDGEPWNEPWGMSLSRSEDLSVDDAVEFLEAGFAAAVALRGER